MVHTLELIELTPQMAQVLLENMSGQRHVGRVDVEQYAKDMKEGRWIANIGDPICISWTGNLLNGQHRCHAVIKAGVPAPMYLARNVDPALFAVLDCGRKRRPADALTIRGLVEKNVSLTAAIIRYLVLLERYGTVNKTERVTPAQAVEFMVANKQQVEAAVAAAASVRSISAPIGAVYYHFAEASKEKADQFVKLLREEMFSDLEHPARILLKKIRSHAKGTRIDRELIVSWIFYAFNAYFSNRRIRVIRPTIGDFSVSDAAFQLGSTPYPHNPHQAVEPFV